MRGLSQSYRSTRFGDYPGRQQRARSRVPVRRASAKHRSPTRKLAPKRQDSSDKTREIQKILTLDDPEEQVARFLSLIKAKNGQKKTPSISSDVSIF